MFYILWSDKNKFAQNKLKKFLWWNKRILVITWKESKWAIKIELFRGLGGRITSGAAFFSCNLPNKVADIGGFQYEVAE